MRKHDVQAVKRLISGEDDWTAFMPYFEKFRDTISLALGHSYGSRITQVYINPDLRKADEAVRRLIDWVFRK